MYRKEKDDKDKAWFANIKRTYDEYQNESLESVRRNREYATKVLSDAQQFDNQRQAIANQALQNAVENANITAKQAIRHSDIAIDRQWNVDEQAFVVAEILNDRTFKDAISAAVAMAVNEVANKPKK